MASLFPIADRVDRVDVVRQVHDRVRDRLWDRVDHRACARIWDRVTPRVVVRIRACAQEALRG